MTSAPPFLPGPMPLARAHSEPLSRHQRIALACALVPAMAVWLLNGWYLPLLAAVDARLLWAADVLQWVVLPATLVWLLASRASLPPRCYGLGLAAHKPFGLAWKSLAIWLSAGLVFVVTRNLVWRILGPGAASLPLAQHWPTDWMRVLALLYAAITAGVVESILFIGMPWAWYAGSARRASPRGFTVIASLVFALAHWEHGSAVVGGAFLCHTVLCAWFFHCRSLWPIAGGHTLVDLGILA